MRMHDPHPVLGNTAARAKGCDSGCAGKRRLLEKGQLHGRYFLWHPDTPDKPPPRLPYIHSCCYALYKIPALAQELYM